MTKKKPRLRTKAELERLLDESEAMNVSLFMTLYDIRKASGDPNGKIMLSDLADHIDATMKDYRRLKAKEEKEKESKGRLKKIMKQLSGKKSPLRKVEIK